VSGLARRQQEFLAALLDEEAPLPAGWQVRHARGLAIYRNNYRGGLIDTLRDTYPRTEVLAGEAAFARAAAHHCITHPPSSWTLDQVGAGFSATCAELFRDDPDVAELAALEWAKSIGGLPAMIERANANAKVLTDWIEATPYVRNMVDDPAKRTNTGVCFVFQGEWFDSLSEDEQAAVPGKIYKMLEAEGVGYDFNGYRDAPPSLRIWCGGTVEQEDLKRLLPWIEWAYEQVKNG